MNILLVEDEPTMRSLFGYMLKKEGYNVLEAENGRIALEVLSRITPDAIVCDIMMPEMDGFEFREILQQRPEFSEIPFLYLSAYNSEENIMKGLGMDVEDFIPKTDGPQVMVTKMKNALRKREKIRSNMANELDKASQTTGVLLNPATPPKIAGYSVQHFNQGHEGIPGGDFVDFISTDNQVLAVIGDVMGKHWKAWVFAHAYAAYLRSSVRVLVTGSQGENIRTGEILNRMNEAIFHDDQVGNTLCAITLVSIKPNSPEIVLSNALQYPLLLFRANQSVMEEVQTEDTGILGLRKEANFEEVVVRMETGDILFCFTDGLSELFASEDQTKGFHFVKDGITKYLNSGADADAKKIVNHLLELSGLSAFEDDTTLLLIKKIG
ncbi:MAG: response regulator [Balneolales bacterium]|nr:response regulator [Balneolales bacterium]